MQILFISKNTFFFRRRRLRSVPFSVWSGSSAPSEHTHAPRRIESITNYHFPSLLLLRQSICVDKILKSSSFARPEAFA